MAKFSSHFFLTETQSDKKDAPRILRIITRLNTGGPERQVRFLHQHFSPHAWLLHGKVSADERDEEKRNPLKSPQLLFLPQLKRSISPLDDLYCLWWLYSWLGKNEIDIIHTHTAKAGWVGRAAGYLHNRLRPHKKKIKLVHTFHGHVFSGYFSPLIEKIFRRVEKILWTRTDRILVLGEKQFQDIVHHLKADKERVRIVPLGLNLDKFLVSPVLACPPKYEHIAKKQWVGWVGRLVDIKNPFRFLDIAQALKEKGLTDTGFALAGGGHLEHELRLEIKKRGLEDEVFLLGWRDDLAELYSSFKLLFNTSDNEGTPLSAIEALSAGTPCALARVGSSEELIQTVAVSWCFEPEHWKQYLDSWLAFLKNPTRLSIKERQEIGEKYSQQRLAQDLEKIYEELKAF